MKKVFLIMTICLFSLSCSDKDTPSELRLYSDRTVQFPANKDLSGSLEFYSSGEWTIQAIDKEQKKVNWVVFPEYKKTPGTHTVPFTVESNTSSSSRTCYIAVMCGDKTIYVTINQSEA